MRKVIMKTTQLHHNISKIDLENVREISDVYRLYKREKKKYFNNLDLNKITNNKVFWKTVKPLLLDKGISTTRISLTNDNKMITEDTKVANTLDM